MGLRFKGDTIREEEESMMMRVLINNWKDLLIDNLMEIGNGMVKEDLPVELAIAILANNIAEIVAFMEPNSAIPTSSIKRLETSKDQIKRLKNPGKEIKKQLEEAAKNGDQSTKEEQDN